MDTDSQFEFQSEQKGETPPVPEQRLDAISELLKVTEKSEQSQKSEQPSQVAENQLLQVKLGIASSLFVALRSKHAPSAAHCVRVSMLCSAWATYRKMSLQQRDELEVAALLHDVGKIGVPDFVLTSPGSLTESESMLMERHHQAGADILEQCCADSEIFDAVRYGGAWFDGSKDAYDLKGKEIPESSRLLAIADAYDSMTTDQLYRRTRSKERALAELFAFAGTQFDPELVEDFSEFQSTTPERVQHDNTTSWLKNLKPVSSNAYWNRADLQVESEDVRLPIQFHENLFRHIHDGIIYIDADAKIIRWNHAAERLTGISADAVVHRTWSPFLLEMRDEAGKRITEELDPVSKVLSEGLQAVHRFSVRRSLDEFSTVTMHIVPLTSDNGAIQGVTVQLRDASGMLQMEEKVQHLKHKATTDPLTNLANRAEFNRALEEYVERHKNDNRPCSLIICDIDFFKQVNDTYGHQAGDDAIITFASVLRKHATSSDLAARYGGEEFVLLCGDCDNSTGAAKAEEIRKELSEIPFESLGGKNITASFGVTELQAGDNDETMLNRADRALLHAKEMGRNMVIQLGSGFDQPDEVERRPWWSRWLPEGSKPDALVSRCLVSKVPMAMVTEKLRGFISDHEARVIDAQDDRLLLMIDKSAVPFKRRTSDRASALEIEVRLEEDSKSETPSTIIHAKMSPSKGRERRKGDGVKRARQLMLSLQSYLMAYEVVEESETALGSQKAQPQSKSKNAEGASWWKDLFTSVDLEDAENKADKPVK